MLNIIGAGRLGQTLGYLFAQQNVRIGAVFNRTEQRNAAALAFIGAGQPCTYLDSLPHADITLITTPDDHITTICEQLSAGLKPNSIVLHCSGLLSSDCLISAKERGCYVASVHPLDSFASPAVSIRQYQDVYCAIEGDDEALTRLEPLFQAIGSITHRINKDKKALYHAGGVFASNYLVTLSEQAMACLLAAGIEESLAIKAIGNIMHHTIHHVRESGSPVKSLTGPLQRGDIATLQTHLDALQEMPQRTLYSALGKATLLLTTLAEQTKQTIQKLLGTVKQ